MSLAAHFSTKSGSRYAVTEAGACTVTRSTGHPMGEAETFEVTAIRTHGDKAVLSLKDSTEVVLTSVLDLGMATCLPHAVWQGGTWTVGEEPFPPVPHPVTLAPEPRWVRCTLCGYERPVGLGCGLPCV